MSKSITRRDFLRKSAGGVLGAAGLSMLGPLAAPLSAIAEQPKEAAPLIPIDWTDGADVIIVGGGGAGYCAAIEAGRAGASVLILEKSAIPGGDTAISQGMIMAAGTPEQKEIAGFATDTPELFAKQQLAYAQGFANEDMIREMCIDSPKQIDFMRELGRVYHQVDIIPPAWEFDTEDSWGARSHWDRGNNTGHFDLLQKETEKMDHVRCLTEKPAERLIVDPSHGVIGVTTRDGSHYRADKGVILATGSFGINKEMAQKYNRLHYWVLTVSEKMGTAPFASPNITGDGIRMALEVGAGLALCDSSVTNNMIETGGVGSGYIAELMGIDHKNEYYSSTIPGRILVNSSGRRFVQEDALWGYVNKMIYQEAVRCNWTKDTKPKIWFIQDAKWMEYDAMVQGVLRRNPTLAAQFKQADTLEELADLIEVPAENLKDTINRWNEGCKEGVDQDFKRRIDMKTIEVGPFNAYPVAVLDSGCFGGVDTDIDTRVLDEKGQPIPRLYAAGTIMSGTWCGQFYTSCGWAILGTMHWGRKAGVKSAELAPWTTEKITAKAAEPTRKAVAAGNYKAGTYTAIATGYAGEVPVAVSFSDTEILSVEIGENKETPALGGAVIKLLPEKILAAQSADLDTVSGATLTSQAILAAVKDCIDQASK